ncbi:MAG: hypothetical protein P8013_07555 [Candidatus Sulfobium sp.]
MGGIKGFEPFPGGLDIGEAEIILQVQKFKEEDRPDDKPENAISL